MLGCGKEFFHRGQQGAFVHAQQGGAQGHDQGVVGASHIAHGPLQGAGQAAQFVLDIDHQTGNAVSFGIADEPLYGQPAFILLLQMLSQRGIQVGQFVQAQCQGGGVADHRGTRAQQGQMAKQAFAIHGDEQIGVIGDAGGRAAVEGNVEIAVAPGDVGVIFALPEHRQTALYTAPRKQLCALVDTAALRTTDAPIEGGITGTHLPCPAS